MVGRQHVPDEEHREREHGLRLVLPPRAGAKLLEGARESEGQQRQPKEEEADRIARVAERNRRAQELLAAAERQVDLSQLLIDAHQLLVRERRQPPSHAERDGRDGKVPAISSEGGHQWDGDT